MEVFIRILWPIWQVSRKSTHNSPWACNCKGGCDKIFRFLPSVRFLQKSLRLSWHNGLRTTLSCSSEACCMGIDTRRLWPTSKCDVFSWKEHQILSCYKIKSNKLESNERAITKVLYAVVENQLDIMYLGRIKIISGKHFRILLTFNSVFLHKAWRVIRTYYLHYSQTHLCPWFCWM